MSRGKKGVLVGLALLGLGVALLGSPAGAQLATSPMLGADNLAPVPVAMVMVEADAQALSVEVSWPLSTDDFVRQQPAGMDFTSGGVFVNVNDVAGYKVWRQEGVGAAELLVTLSAGATSYVDYSLERGIAYVYLVSVVDPAGNESSAVESEEVFIRKLSKQVKMTIEASKTQVDLLLANAQSRQKLIQDLIAVLAAQMGIDPSRINILSLASGSLIVEFEILEPPAGSTEATAEAAFAALVQQVTQSPAAFGDAIDAGTALENVGNVQAGEPTPATIDLSGVAFNFAQVKVREASTKELTITNKGDLELRGSLAVSGGAVFAVSPASFILAKGAEQVATITFTPADTVVYSAALVISSNDPQKPTVTVALSGKGVGEVTMALPGDFDNTGVVDFDDFFLFADHFGTNAASPNWDAIYDLDDSGDVGFDDFFIFADNFGRRL